MKTTLCLLLLLPVVSSYNTKLIGRRTALVGLVSSAVTPASAVVSSKPCVSGVGEGCAELSEGNAYIQSLQAKSAENKEKNAREARDTYYMKNYPDFFATVGQTLVKKSDGTFVTMADSEFNKLRKAGKIKVEIPKAMGGRVTDLTQKPIAVLVE